MVRKVGWAASLAMLALALAPYDAMAAGPLGGGLSGGGLLIPVIGGLLVIGMGVAAAGCGQGQGRLAAATMESIGRNPESADRLFVPMIVGLAFIEALALYTLVLAFFVLQKV